MATKKPPVKSSGYMINIELSELFVVLSFFDLLETKNQLKNIAFHYPFFNCVKVILSFIRKINVCRIGINFPHDIRIFFTLLLNY